MLHRHLYHQQLSLAAIDDVISHGQWDDWVDLRRGALNDGAVLEKVQRVCCPMPYLWAAQPPSPG